MEKYWREYKLEGIVSITGPMFAGKSKALIEIIKILCNECVVFKSPKHSKDFESMCLKSNKGCSLGCESVDTMLQIAKQKKFNYYLLDEYQFIESSEFKKILEYFKNNPDQTLVVVGLDFIAKNEPWKNYILLEKYSSTKIKLCAKCQICREFGIEADAEYYVETTGKRAEEWEKMYKTKIQPRCKKHFDFK